MHDAPRQILVLTRQPDSYTAQRFAATGAADETIDLQLVDPHVLYLQLHDNFAHVTGLELNEDCSSIRVIPRLGSTASEYALAALRQLELAGAATLNKYDSLMRLRFKFSALGELAAAGLKVPDTEMLRAPSDIAPAVERLGGYPVVLKFLRGSQGVGVVFAPDESVAVSVLEALNLIQYDVMLQRFYPAAAQSDLRVLVLGDEPRWAVRRSSNGGRFRSNFHRGGKVEKVELTAEIADLARKAAGVFELGLAGVDLIEDDGGLMVLEVNSSPGFQTIDLAHGVDVAREIVGYVRTGL